MKQSLIRDKSYEFALKVVEAYRDLETRNERVLSRQMLRAGTSIGANVEEALAGQSRADFLSKMAIAEEENLISDEAAWRPLFMTRSRAMIL